MDGSPSPSANTKPRFTLATLAFIRKAGRQKRVDWLDRHRDEYERLVLGPIQHLARTTQKKLAREATGYRFPQKGIARLKRSSSSREEHGGYAFRGWVTYTAAKPRVSRFDHNPNLFFMIDPDDRDGDEILVAGGLYMPSSRQMRKLREAIAADASAFERLFATRSFRTRFPGGFSLERKSSRVPRGFDPNHPRLKWIQLQSFFVWRSYSRKEFTSPRFAEIVTADWAEMVKLNTILYAILDGRMPVAPPAPRKTRQALERIADISPRYQADF
jgi:uncharacterized protein (TIGR02453 family)